MSKVTIDDFSKESLWEVFVELNKRVDRWNDIWFDVSDKQYEQDKDNTVNNIILDHVIWSYADGIRDVVKDMSNILLNRPSPRIEIRIKSLEKILGEYNEEE